MLSPRLALLMLVAQVSGCMIPPRSDSSAGAVFRSGWQTTITHVGVDAVSSAVFAVANHNIAIALRENLPAMEAEAFLVPHPQGYDVVVLSKHPLSRSEEDDVRHVVDAAFDDARNDRPMYKKKG